MWIISTILEGGSIEDAIIKAIAMNAKRPSHFPPQGLVLTMLDRISQATPEVETGMHVIKGSRAAV